jgi:hypothetical protein
MTPKAGSLFHADSQNTTKNRQLEPGLPAPNPSAKMSVNLDSGPWTLAQERRAILARLACDGMRV